MDLSLDFHPCPKCGKVLEVGIEFHDPLACLEYAARYAINGIPLWEFKSIERFDDSFIIQWTNVVQDIHLQYPISRIEYRSYKIPLTDVLELWIRSKLRKQAMDP